MSRKKNTQNDTATISNTNDNRYRIGKSFLPKKKKLTRRVRVKSKEEVKNVDVKKEKKNKNS